MTARVLTIAQYARLDTCDDDVRVVGWAEEGPVLRMPNGSYRRVKTDGRLVVAVEPS